jgi:Flp pilus assembly protein TadG
MKILTGLAVSALALFVTACDIDTSALKEIEDTAAQAQATAAEINSRSAQIQQAVDDPVGAVRGVVTANLSRVPTDQPGIYVLTDLETGCQFLATYAADGATVSSVAPRVEPLPGGGTRQRCIPVPGGAGRASADEG